MQEGAHRKQRRLDISAEWLRKQGLAKADKKAGRVAAEGRIAVAQDHGKAVLVEINSETDFVAKDHNFLAFTDAVAQAALASRRRRRRSAQVREACRPARPSRKRARR